MKYYIHLSADYWTAKNKLQAAYKYLAQIHNGTLLKDKLQLEAWISIFKAQIQEINEEYSKCKAPELRIWKPSDKEEMILITVTGVFQIEALPVYHEPEFIMEDGK